MPPLGAWVVYRLYSRSLVSRAQVIYAFLLVGVPGQPVFAVGPMIAANKGYLGYAAQHAVQLGLQLGVIPGLAFLLARAAPSKAAKGGEDAFFCDEAKGTFGVADGVGGSASAFARPNGMMEHPYLLP